VYSPGSWFYATSFLAKTGRGEERGELCKLSGAVTTKAMQYIGIPFVCNIICLVFIRKQVLRLFFPCSIFLSLEVLRTPSQVIKPVHEFKLPTDHTLHIYPSMHLYLPVQLAVSMSDSASSSPWCLYGLPSPSYHTCHAAV